jgi:hypothetical protein
MGLSDGPLRVSFSLSLSGRPVPATLLATISRAVVLSEGEHDGRAITVQEIVGAQVEADGRRLPIADDALYMLMKRQGIELDWRLSSPPETSTAPRLSPFGAKPLVTVDAHGFRLRKRGEDKRFHSGVVAIRRA